MRAEQTPIQEVFALAIDIERSENRNPTKVLYGRPWFERLVAEAYPEQDAWYFEAHDPIATYARQRDIDNRATRDRLLSRWDKYGNQLIGLAMCPRSAMGDEVEVR